MSGGDPRDNDYVAKLVRDLDRPRYYATLFAPEAIRPDLLALYGFAVEIERIPDLVTDARLGEIRLQFWQDRLEGLGGPEDPGSPPVLRALSAAIARHALPVPPLIALVEGRRADLYSDPPATFADAEGLLGETQSSLFQLAALVAGSSGPETADASGHAGIAYGLARRLALLGRDEARRRTILPLEILQTHGLASADLFLSPAAPKLAAVIGDTVAHARRHLREAQAALARLPRDLHPPFLPLATVEPLLTKVERLGLAIHQKPAVLSDLETLSRLGWARIAGIGRGGRVG